MIAILLILYSSCVDLDRSNSFHLWYVVYNLLYHEIGDSGSHISIALISLILRLSLTQVRLPTMILVHVYSICVKASHSPNPHT